MWCCTQLFNSSIEEQGQDRISLSFSPPRLWNLVSSAWVAAKCRVCIPSFLTSRHSSLSGNNQYNSNFCELIKNYIPVLWRLTGRWLHTCSGQPGLNSENLTQKKRALSPVSDLAHFIAGYYSNHIGVGYAICVCVTWRCWSQEKTPYFSKLLIS